MGRVKLKIKKLENTNGRQATYGKRKHGILKKANELSILCDIPIILLMFSPTGKPSLCKGKRSIEEVITKFAQLTPQERTKRKLESLEALKKTFKRLDHEVNISEFFGSSSQTIEDLTNQSNLLQNQLSETQKRLSYWTNLDKINSVDLVGQLENSVRESLSRIQAQKEYVGKQQMVSLDCNSQFQNEMQVPFRMNAEQQQFPPMQWLPNCDNQHIMLPDDSSLLSRRDIECSASSSYGSYSGYYPTGKGSDLSNSRQESVVSGILNELNGNTSLRMQLPGQQYPYMPYNLNLLDEVKFQPTAQMSLQEIPPDFHLNGSFEVPKPNYCTTPGSWASTSGPCSVTMFDDQLFSQQPN
ncbi:Agamous-like MADS-box protein AGL30 [Linum grandiflorum]